MRENCTRKEPVIQPSKACLKHIVLFIVACALLAGCLVTIGMGVDLAATPKPDDSELLDGGLMVGMIHLLANFILLGGFVICWSGGQAISALLAYERENKPRWLWVSSMVIALVHLALLAVVIAVQLLI